MWPRAIAALLGSWLMAAPAVLGYGDPARTHDYIVGPLVVSVAIIAMAEATRPLRWLNAAAGAWLLVAPFVLGFEPIARLNALVTGVLLLACALVRGRVRSDFGGGWAMLWRGERAVARVPRGRTARE